MRVLHLFKTYLPDSMGGIEQTIFQLCEACLPWGVTSSVLTLSAKPSPHPLRVGNHQVSQAKLHPSLAPSGLSRAVLARYLELAREHDVVDDPFPRRLMDLLHLLAPHDTPSVLSSHSEMVRQRVPLQFYRSPMQQFLGSGQCLVTA